MSDNGAHIGTLQETPLHASLKAWYAMPGDLIEAPIDRFVIDLVRDDLLIEIQTSGFSSMRQKVIDLLDLGHRVRIVHPIPVDKWIVKIDDGGAAMDRRLSPKHGKPSDIFSELVSFPELVARRQLEIEMLMTVEEEYRRHSPEGPWRRKGWTVVERRLVEVTGAFLITEPEELTDLLPTGLPDDFTTADIANLLSVSLRSAQQMTYCLRKIGEITPVDKKGNSVLYRRAD